MENSKTAFRNYLQLEKKYSPHTVNAYLNDLISFETYINSEFDSEDLLNVNYSLIRSWIVTLVDAQISNTSVNRKISSLKSYYKFLLKTKQIVISPLLKHKSLKTPKTLQIPFSEKELDEVLNLIIYTLSLLLCRSLFFCSSLLCLVLGILPENDEILHNGSLRQVFLRRELSSLSVAKQDGGVVCLESSNLSRLSSCTHCVN